MSKGIINLKEMFDLAQEVKKKREDVGFHCAECGTLVNGQDYRMNNWYYTSEGQMCKTCGQKYDPWKPFVKK